MDHFDEYLRQGEPNKAEKGKKLENSYWFTTSGRTKAV